VGTAKNALAPSTSFHGIFNGKQDLIVGRIRKTSGDGRSTVLQVADREGRQDGTVDADVEAAHITASDIKFEPLAVQKGLHLVQVTRADDSMPIHVTLGRLGHEAPLVGLLAQAILPCPIALFWKGRFFI